MNEQPKTPIAALSPAELAHASALAIGRSHHAQSAINLDILNHVAQHKSCGFTDLHDLFGDVTVDNKTRERFRARLNYLVDSGQLQAKGAARHRLWSMPSDFQVEAPPAEPLPAWLGAATAPSQYDRLRGPVYVPQPGPPLRAGSSDFKRCASVGHRC